MPFQISFHPYTGPVVTREEALAVGFARYFEGAECTHGHVSERTIKTGRCVECTRISRNEYAIRYRAKHKDRFRKIWRAEANDRRLADPYLVQRAMEGRKARKLAIEETAAGRKKPDLCEICGEHHLRIVFDHDHATGLFRGWICDRCNKTLGHVKDNPNIFLKMAGYLTTTSRYSGRPVFMTHETGFYQ